MKSSSEIKGLKIISISEGQQVSTVKDIILDTENGCLAFFIIDQPSDYLGARVIAYNDTIGLGDYALIIADQNVIQDVAHSPLAIELLRRDIRVIGAQVLSESGSLIGEVTEMMIDENTGRIAVCQVSTPQGTSNEISCDNVIKYGKDIIILGTSSFERGQVPKSKIKDKVQNLDKPQSADKIQNIDKIQSLDKIQSMDIVQVLEKFQPLDKLIDDKEILKKRIEEFGKHDHLLKTVGVSEAGRDYPQEFNVFEQRQLQFLVGKTLNTDISLDNGQVLYAGQQITPESLNGVKTRSTLMQITAHVVK